MKILFVHGAGGWQDDQPLAEELRAVRGATVSAPRFPDDDMSVAAWRRELTRHRTEMGPDTLIVAHSFGASIALLDVAVDPVFAPPPVLVLLAMPFWGPEGWSAEYALPAGAAPPEDLPVWLHQCLDDEIVPAEHLDHHVRELPRAHVRRYDTGGHQFVGRMAAVAKDLPGFPPG